MILSRPSEPYQNQRYQFVTGRLASPAISAVVDELSIQHGFVHHIQILPITVAALITPKWLRRHLEILHDQIDAVFLPGYCKIAPDDPLTLSLQDRGIDIILGPNDCRQLPLWFGQSATPPDLTRQTIEIIAEINHAPRMPVQRCVDIATGLIADGADRIDIGCDPQQRCTRIADYVSAVRQLGVAVSIDSFDPAEVIDAVGAGADLVLSVNGTNCPSAIDYGCEVVAIPDTPRDLDSLDRTIAFLTGNNIPLRIDPILEPIGSGLTDSIVRYHDVRRRYPDAAMMMGIGNLTELTDVDSAGVNFLLLGLCAELDVQSVLTTQVINWARTSVRECEVARRLVHYSVQNGVPPKRLCDSLIMLRDDRLTPMPSEMLDNLSDNLKDNNYRIFAQDETLRIISAGMDLADTDPFRLFETLLQQPQSDNVDASHAFYLGFELAKAMTALQLGKQYNQDQSLDWGMLTVPEDLHRIARTSRHRSPDKDP